MSDSKKTIVKTYREKYRPQFHFSPLEKWMNDPNGLVYHRGVYHLFYQYYPEGVVWGPMHWGHAVSRDLIHWEQKAIALYPDVHGWIFSGCAVVDIHNSSALGTLQNPPLVAVFTYHNEERKKKGFTDYETQGIAYSVDNGESWQSYKHNPVLANKESIKDFRDPKVFWYEKTQKWIMVLVAGDHARFYSSENLITWNYLSAFGYEQGAHGGVWECPDLFPLPVSITGEEKWVLLISINSGAPNGGSGTQYFIGDFNGEVFVSPQTEPQWLDHGTDNYATVTFNNVPDEKRICIGWMNNWNYAEKVPTHPWRGAMTLPRELSLQEIRDTWFLCSYPLSAFEKLKDTVHTVRKKVEIVKACGFDGSFNQCEVRFHTTGQDFVIEFSNAENDIFFIECNRREKRFHVNRTQAGQTGFAESFAEGPHTMPIPLLPEGAIEIRIILDWSSIEIFLNKGQYVMTQQVFPRSFFTRLQFKNRDTAQPLQIINLMHYKVKSVR
ncbi:glycoside hydrolase family 32 protein [Ascidiimonas aurantiaca]|uniref:glycoside hydrolase family 32 protein n=1 Tax=Ascidiimonas aurantiaca TaxID=1685432 RepID=UPI0030ED9F7D